MPLSTPEYAISVGIEDPNDPRLKTSGTYGGFTPTEENPRPGVYTLPRFDRNPGEMPPEIPFVPNPNTVNKTPTRTPNPWTTIQSLNLGGTRSPQQLNPSTPAQPFNNPLTNQNQQMLQPTIPQVGQQTAPNIGPNIFNPLANQQQNQTSLRPMGGLAKKPNTPNTPYSSYPNAPKLNIPKPWQDEGGSGGGFNHNWNDILTTILR